MTANLLKLLRFVPGDKVLPWMSRRRLMLSISLALVVSSLFLVAFRGLDLGIDFTGGALIEVKTDGPADLAELRSRGEAVEGIASVQLFGADDLVLIRLSAENLTERQLNDRLGELRSIYGGAVAEIRRAELVGPTVGDELKFNSAIALATALLMIMVYVWFRFEWQLGFCAIVALLHDVTIVLGLYSLFAIPFSIQTVAAILAVAGYSINDTVVLFDRLREVRRKYRRLGASECINRAIQECLSRTFMTSFTTLLAITALLVFGGSALRDFLWALCFGVIVGTYSSVAVAMGLLSFAKIMEKPQTDD